MKRIGIAVLFTCVATFAVAQEQTDTTATAATTTAAPPKDSALVRASKQSTRKTAKPKHVITNADVKKSTGKLLVTTPKSTGAPATAEVNVTSPKKTPDENALYKQRQDAALAVSVAEKKVAELEHELAQIEQDYYEENDPNKRDTTITKRFAQTKKQLADARGELADARDAQGKIK